MLYRPQKLSDTNSATYKTLNHPSPTSSQYGPFLLSIPRESLTHISCYLDPRSLYDLSRVCRALLRHVTDDNTWRRAFAFQLLGISPENDLEGEQAVLLRRTESSWKQEFIRHDRLRRRWAKSHNGAVTHTPHHANISEMHLMPSHALLSSSLAYGIVARSHPLKGTVVRGFFEPSGSGPGAGNPNAEFAPNVSACALASEGNTARIAWGLGHGEVRVTIAGKAMEPTAKTSAKWMHCLLADEHQGSVSDMRWDGLKIVSVGTDGIAKVWESKDVSCLWASPKPTTPTPLVKVASSLDKGAVVAVRSTGDIVVWDGVGSIDVTESIIPCPSEATEPIAQFIFLDFSSTQATILVSYTDDSFAHAFRRDLSSTNRSFTHVQYGNESFGPIRSIQPYFSEIPGEKGFFLMGDSLGCVSLYDLERSVLLHRLEVFEDGDPVTALCRNSIVLVVGSAKGVVKIFDGYTFELLRTFTFPPPKYRRGTEKVKDPVTRILLSKDQEVMAVSAGDSAMGWLAGPVVGNGRGMRGRALGSPSKKKAKNTNAKYREQVELNQSIRESKQALAYENKLAQQEFNRQRAHMQSLDALGLSEAEAIEYLLMISREEEEARSRPSQDLVFEDDMPGVQRFSVDRSTPVTPPRRPIPISDDHDEFPSISPSSAPRHSPPSAWSTPSKSREWTPSSMDSSAASSYRSDLSFGDEDEDLRLAIQLSLQEV